MITASWPHLLKCYAPSVPKECVTFGWPCFSYFQEGEALHVSMLGRRAKVKHETSPSMEGHFSSWLSFIAALIDTKRSIEACK